MAGSPLLAAAVQRRPEWEGLEDKRRNSLRRFPDRCRENLLLILLLISTDLSFIRTRINTGDFVKSERHAENKKHTNTDQPSPPLQQQRLQSPSLRQIQVSIALTRILVSSPTSDCVGFYHSLITPNYCCTSSAATPSVPTSLRQF